MRLDRFKLNMEALLIEINVNLEVTVICLIVIDVIVENLIDVDYLRLHFFGCIHELLS